MVLRCSFEDIGNTIQSDMVLMNNPYILVYDRLKACIEFRYYVQKKDPKRGKQ